MIKKTTTKEEVLAKAAECAQCGRCCTYGSGYLADDDLEKLSAHLGLSEEETKERYLDQVDIYHTKLLRPKTRKEGKPYGPCIFLEGKRCSIHEAKPLLCRISSCEPVGKDMVEWFLLNYTVNPDDPVSLNEWEAKLQRYPTIPGGSIKELEEGLE